jgi:hypothetical protein
MTGMDSPSSQSSAQTSIVIITHQRKPHDCSCTKGADDGPSAVQFALGEPAP